MQAHVRVMRWPSVLIGVLLIAAVLSACEAAIPAPTEDAATPAQDVESTVQAMVEARLTTEPTTTPTQDVESTVQAMVEARLTTEPTHDAYARC